MTVNLEPGKAFLAKATEGPWEVEWAGPDAMHTIRSAEYETDEHGFPKDVDHEVCIVVDSDAEESNARAIVWMHNNMPAMIEELERLREALAPFASFARLFDPCYAHQEDDYPMQHFKHKDGEVAIVTVGDWRRARVALNGGGDE